MDVWMGALRFGLRGLVRNPAWGLAVLLTMALGTGAATSLFSVSYSVLFQPLPYPDAEELVRVHPENNREPGRAAAFSVPDWEDWRDATRTLQHLGLYTTLPSDLVLTGYGDAVELETAYVTSGFFEALAVPASLGTILQASDEDGDNRKVVLSDGVWRRVFGSDPDVIGTTLMLKAEPYQVVGVMPPGFGYPSSDVELYTFLSVIPASSTPLHLRVVRFLDAVGRLAPGTTPEQAKSELASIAVAVAEANPETNARLTGALVTPLKESVVADVRPSLLTLMGGAGLFLLAALINVSGLVLVRQLSRAPELGIRTSLGAARGDLIRQTLAETGLVAVLGTAGGVLLAILLTGALVGLAGSALPRATEVSVGIPALAFALVLSAVSCAVAALLPSRTIGKLVHASLRGARGGGPGGGRTRRALVGGQVAVATIMVILAGLMVRSLREMSRVDPGFQPEGRLVAVLNISSTLYPERTDYLGFYRQYLEELEAIPGVTGAGSLRYFPTRGVGESYNWSVPGEEPPTVQNQAYLLQASVGLPAALGMRVREGRSLSDQDAEGTPGVVVNHTLARLAFGETPAVGRTLLLDDDYPVEIVGVVDDVRQRGLGVDPDPTVYMHQESNPRRSMAFVLSTDQDPLVLAGAVRDRLREMDPGQPLAELTTAEALLSGSLARPRFLAVISSAFGILATLLALVAVGGAVAHAIGGMKREIGIRVALGQEPRSVGIGILKAALTPVAFGLGAGTVATLVLARFLDGVLFGVAPRDPATMTLSLIGLFSFALIACLLPIRRVGAVDPVSAMRAE